MSNTCFIRLLPRIFRVVYPTICRGGGCARKLASRNSKNDAGQEWSVAFPEPSRFHTSVSWRTPVVLLKEPHREASVRIKEDQSVHEGFGRSSTPWMRLERFDRNGQSFRITRSHPSLHSLLILWTAGNRGSDRVPLSSPMQDRSSLQFDSLCILQYGFSAVPPCLALE